MNVPKLRGRMVELGVSVGELAGRIGINRASLYRKFKNDEKVTIGEAQRIKEALNLTDDEAYQIFLA